MTDPKRAVPNSGLAAALRANKGLDEAVRNHAAKQVQATSEKEVLAILREEGITTLEDLVRETLTSVKGGLLTPGQVGKDTFIYTQAIYKKEMPIPDGMVQQIRQGGR